MSSKSIYIILFVYGLLIPKISGLIIIFTGLYSLLIRFNQIVDYYLIEVGLLLLFLLSYYMIGITYNYYSVGNLVFFTFLGIFSYIFGATVNLHKLNISKIFLSIVTGLIVYSFISFYQTYFTGHLEQALSNRLINNMWTGKEENSPVIGAYALLVLALSITLFIGKLTILERWILSVLSVMSIIMLIGFQSRGPFLSVSIIFFFTYVYLKSRYNIRIIKVKYIFVIILLVLLVLLYMGDSIASNTLITSYSDRLEKKGLESARFELWKMGMEALFVQPFGGKEMLLQVGRYRSDFIHNTWLDINYEVGIIPLVFIVLFIGKHLKYIKSLFVDVKQNDDNIYFFVIGLGLILPTFFEPMMNASFIFISLLSFYLALLKNYYYFKRGIV